MKKKLFSLVCGVFMMVFSVFSLASCSLVSTDTEKENKAVVLKMGDTEFTKSDILSSFYTYYQNNSSYFSYYDEETIEESFYTWAIIKELINQKSAESIYNVKTNPEGFIVYSQENEDNVWKNTYDYIYSQISSYEKNIYKSAGYAEANYPVWISGETDDETATSFEAYEKISPEGVCLDKSKAVERATEEEILDRIVADDTSLMKYLFEHAVETDEDGNETRKKIKDIIAEEQRYNTEIEKDKFIVNARNEAYTAYMESLKNNAKSAGKKVDEEVLFNEEIVRVYEAYYESEVTTLLQTYYLNDYLLDSEGDTPLTEKAVAEAFLNDYYSDYQTYQFEDAYITTMTNKDGASLVLYHYDGQNYFFTVQHILVQNDDYISEQIKELPGYDSTGNFDYDASEESSVANQFLKDRKDLTDNYFMAAAVNKDNIKDVIEVDGFADYYYYDETRANEANNWGYISVVKIPDGEDAFKYYEKIDADPGYDETKEIEESKVLYLATDEQIEACYKENYEGWFAIAQTYRDYLTAENQTEIDKMREDYADMSYVFDTVEVIANSGKPADVITLEIKQKIASYVFVELEWLFSSDSLGNALSNKMGYVMSNYPDEHGSWVPEFADGARELIKNIKENGANDFETVQAGLEAILKGEVLVSDGNGGTVPKDVNDLTIKIISTYGYHIIKVENVYECGSSIVDFEAIKTTLGSNQIDLNTEAHVVEVIKAMKNTFVCTASNQTLYDYYFDELYTGFVGSSWLGDTSENATSGTYFLKLEYEWLYELYQADEIEYVNKVTYKELMNSIG